MCIITPTRLEELAVNETSTGTQKSIPSLHRSRFFLEHESSTALGDVYEVEGSPIGHGGFGMLWRARLQGQEMPWNRVVKTLSKRSNSIEKLRNEALIMKSLDHPNVCRAFETFEDFRSFHIVLELIEGCNLFEFAFGFASTGETLEEHTASHITKQILQGLHYCHGRGIVHRDLKPENIMVQDTPERLKPNIKIIDFGLATWTEIGENGCDRFVGTRSYAAPEVTRDNRYSPASDLWSVGVIVHAILLGALPSDEVRDGVKEIDVLDDPGYENLSWAAQEFLQALLHISPKDRIGAARSLMISADSWIHVVADTASNEVHVSSDALESLTGVHRTSLLQKAVVMATALQLMETLPVQDIKKQFVSMDIDGDGMLSKSDLSRFIGRHTIGMTGEDVASLVEFLFDSMDTDNSGEIDYAEYLAATLDQGSLLSKQAIASAFRVFDVDNSGKIDSKKFLRVLDMTPEDLATCMKEFDIDNDGKINLTEFTAIVLQPSYTMTASSQRLSLAGESEHLIFCR